MLATQPAQRQVLRIPNIEPRAYQLPFYAYLDKGGTLENKRAVLMWARRLGKDFTCMAYLCKAALQRVGTYAYCLPEYAQARRVCWDGLANDGQRMLHVAFPPSIVEKSRDQDMTLILKNGSVIKFIGSDNADTALVGTNLMGIIFSEAALSSKSSWELAKPIIQQTKGFAIFISTPRGENWFTELFDYAETDPAWFAEKRTILDHPYVTPAEIEAEIKAGMPRALAEQEYYVSRNGGAFGAYYAAELAKITAKGQILDLPYDPRYPVITAWDLGWNDATAVIFFQRKPGGFIDVIDYYESQQTKLADDLAVLREKGYHYGGHIFPHDGNESEKGSGLTPKATAESLGFKPIVCAPKYRKATGIEAVRGIFPKLRFDRVKCQRLVKALGQYKAKYDEDTKTFSKEPLHDEWSDAADAMRYLAVTPEYMTTVPTWYSMAAQGFEVRPQGGGSYSGAGSKGWQVTVPDADLPEWARQKDSEYDPLADFRGTTH